jgi:hypothetical protein
MTDQLTISVQSYDMPVVEKYHAGHVLNENEAKALNQTRWENLRNNFASTVKAAVKEHFGGEPEEDARLPDDKIAELVTEFEALSENYQFHVRQPGSGAERRDPVLAEAMKMALSAIKNQIRSEHGKVTDYKSEDLNAAAKNIVETDEEYMEAARKTVATREKMAAKAINIAKAA